MPAVNSGFKGNENGINYNCYYSQLYPAMVVELKWNKDSATALQQIKDKQYPESILNYTGDILLVGINYDKGTKEHQCMIEKYEKD